MLESIRIYKSCYIKCVLKRKIKFKSMAYLIKYPQKCAVGVTEQIYLHTGSIACDTGYCKFLCRT